MPDRLFLFCIIVFSFLILLSCGGDSDYKYPNIRESTTPEVLTQLFFVGKYESKAGVYKYDFESGGYKIFWGTSEETVIKLSYSDDLKYVFFLTASRIGLRRGVSSISNVKLYKIDSDEQSTEMIAEIGDAVQIHAEWISSNYNIQFTRFDLKYAAYINKFNQIYSRFGKLLKEEKESFNFVEDSYPGFQFSPSSLVSPSGNFGIKQKDDSLYIYAAGSKQEIFIDSTGGNILETRWSDEERFVFFTIRKEQGKGDFFEIYIFDIIEKRILQIFSSTRKINFYVTGDLVIFDAVFDNKSSIEIYNYRKNENVNSIKLFGGCGLANIPADLN